MFDWMFGSARLAGWAMVVFAGIRAGGMHTESGTAGKSGRGVVGNSRLPQYWFWTSSMFILNSPWLLMGEEEVGQEEAERQRSVCVAS